MNGTRLRTIEDYREALSGGGGVIVITDNANGDKTHRLSCRYVAEDNFRTKVIRSRERNGSYLYFPTFEEAARETRARRCQVCG